MTYLALLALAITLFVSTNVDDLVVLIGFFADRKVRARDIVAGQYTGMAFLFTVSAAGSLLSLLIPNAYLGLLGIFPILIGIKKLIAFRHDNSENEPTTRASIIGVALVTIANGGDNIGIYMPSFAVHSAGQIVVIAIVFVAMTALWCLLAHWMVSHPKLGAPLRRYAHIIVPLILIGLGLSILHNAGTLNVLFHR